MVAGLVDSFGLSLGWTMFTLLAVHAGGLADAALYNAAMLVGLVLSAPLTTWVANRCRYSGSGGCARCLFRGPCCHSVLTASTNSGSTSPYSRAPY